jgi:hypothetical protein
MVGEISLDYMLQVKLHRGARLSADRQAPRDRFMSEPIRAAQGELKLRPPEKQEAACIRKRRECGHYKTGARIADGRALRLRSADPSGVAARS